MVCDHTLLINRIIITFHTSACANTTTYTNMHNNNMYIICMRVCMPSPAWLNDDDKSAIIVRILYLWCLPVGQQYYKMSRGIRGEWVLHTHSIRARKCLYFRCFYENEIILRLGRRSLMVRELTHNTRKCV